MASFLLRRLASFLPLVLGVVTLTFVLTEAAPGSPADLLLGDRPLAPEVRERIEAAYGLDRPPLVRYLRWVGALVFRGEWGWSVSRACPVRQAVADALPNTLLLSGAALLIQLGGGVVLGLVAARHRDRWPDRLVTLGGLALYAMPPFWIGLMAILGLCYFLPLFPPSSMHSVGAEDWALPMRIADTLWHLALPAAVLGLASAAAMARFLRGSLIRAAGDESVRGARARGVGARRIWLSHVLRRALLPAVSLTALSVPTLVSGSLAIEVVFAWPGMGRLAYDAIAARDFPVVLVVTCLTACLVLVGSLAGDLAMAALDPRIRLGRPAGPGT